jgi:hypothetical protein
MKKNCYIAPNTTKEHPMLKKILVLALLLAAFAFADGKAVAVQAYDGKTSALQSAFDRAVKDYFRRYDPEVDLESLKEQNWYATANYNGPVHIVLQPNNPEEGVYTLTIKWESKSKKADAQCEKWSGNMLKHIKKHLTGALLVL